MDVICFAPANKHRDRLTDAVLGTLPTDDHIEIYKTIDDFTGRLHLPKKVDSIILICAGNRQNLENIFLNRDLFINTRIILLLPDRSETTIAKAHTLNPRFLTFEDQDFREIAEVIAKMRGNFYGDSAQAPAKKLG
jgi:hypothetical protein